MTGAVLEAEMIRLSVKGLAKYMTSAPAAQRKILQDFKYPDEDEPFAMRLYYQDAKDRIEAYHRNGHGRQWLREQASTLSDLARATTSASAKRLQHNARALLQYEEHFAGRRFEVLNGLRMRLIQHGVQIGANPDLHVREGSKSKILKLDFGKEAPDEDVIRIVSQCMFEAASRQISDLTSSSVLYLDVARGHEHRGARAGARTLRDIEAACQAIERIWPTIPEPRRPPRRGGQLAR